MNKVDIIQTTVGLIALGISIPILISGNLIMAAALVIAGCIISGADFKKNS
jgi:hypothetical protein